MTLGLEAPSAPQLAGSTVRFAVVGCGAIADYLHFPALALAAGVRAEVAVDADIARARDAAKRFRAARASADIRSIASEVDAVLLAVPPHLKVEIAREALASGLHVLCEKPLANTARECEELVGAAASAGRLLGVFHQFRFWPNRRWIRDGLRSGAVPFPAEVEVSQGAPYSWQSVTGYTVRRDLVPGGVLLNAGTHPLDTLISWFGDPLDVEYWDDALGGLESNARLSLRFARSVTVRYRQSRTCRLSNEIRLLYDDHQLVVNSSDPFHVWERRGGTPDREVLGDADPAGFLAPAAALYANFAAAVRGEEPLEVDGAEGTRVIRLVERCYDIKRGRPLPAIAPLPGMTF